MTDNQKTELLPCPFCGGEAETLTAESMYGGYLFGIMCNDCRSRGDVYDTEAEAIAAWNARAERGTLTAEQVFEVIERCVKFYEGGDYDAQEIADELNARYHCGLTDEDYSILLDELGVSEMTCSLIEDGDSLHCSNCGGAAEKQSWVYWSYCPNCGAKVVDA